MLTPHSKTGLNLTFRTGIIRVFLTISHLPDGNIPDSSGRFNADYPQGWEKPLRGVITVD